MNGTGQEGTHRTIERVARESYGRLVTYWAVRAHLLQLLGKTSEAVDAFDRAIGLAEDPAVRQFLLQRRG